MKRIKSLFLSILLIGMVSLNSVQGQIILVKNKWESGQTLNILFMNGDIEEKKLFKRAVGLWSKYVNLDFQFHSLSNEEDSIASEFKINTIRVKFNKEEGNFSPLGNNFNLGRFDKVSYLNIKEDANQKIKFISKSAHELGHALGLMHEHQHPDLKYYSSEEEMINICKYLFMLNINKPEELKKCKVNLTGITHAEAVEYGMQLASFDPHSIMLYSDISNTNKGLNDMSISLGDKFFISSEYPFEEALTLKEVKRMHSDDIMDERQWILAQYQKDECVMIEENDNLFLTKQTDARLIKIKILAMSSIDAYFSACTRSLK